MTKEEKVLVIQEIKDMLQDAKVVYVANLEGLNAAQLQILEDKHLKIILSLK